MKKLLFLLVFVPSASLAQAVSGTANLNWIAPTTASDGTTPLTGGLALTKYQVFGATSSIPNSSTMAPTVEVTAPATTATVTMTVTNGQTLYFRVKACNSAGCSLFSTEASKVITLPVPGVPTTVTITLTIVP